MKALYETTVHVSGGREGKARSADGKLEVTLGMPKELGGSATGTSTNPEQLFAAGYAACFESALRHIARSQKITINQSSVDGTVSLYPRAEGGFKLGAKLAVSLPELDRAAAQDLVNKAHAICPYSNATRGNIDVEIVLN